MDYFKYCQKCKETICCSKPFYAFITETEYNKIIKYLKKKNFEFDKDLIFQKFTSIDKDGINTYLILKQENGKCFLLGNDKICLIHEIKPLDCLLWPLTFEFLPTLNIIRLYLGDCLVVRELENLNILGSWVDKQQEILIKNLSKYNKLELIAYSSLPDIPKFKTINQIITFPDNLKK